MIADRFSRARRRRLTRGGFTLIELLLVLVILTALAGVVVPKFAKRSEQARITAARTAITSFEIEAGRYPTTEEGLKALIERPANVREWSGYLESKSVPKDPWGNYYQYRNPGVHNTESYDLWSYGPDGRDGGDDDITNWSEE